MPTSLRGNYSSRISNTLAQAAFRLMLGSRRPRRGRTLIDGLKSRVSIRRDAHGIPTIDAQNDSDAWFGLGFCHSQDRGGQLEFLRRAARGELSALVGADGLVIDRLSRRLGFRRAAERQLTVLDSDALECISAYARGINAAIERGSTRIPHDLALLRSRPTPWSAVDVLTYIKLQSFLLPSNWDVELARFKIASLDGIQAALDLDPALTGTPPHVTPGTLAEFTHVVDRLSEDLRAFAEIIPIGGGSNNWVIAADKTATGRPLLSNDPHLNPIIPPPWYLAQIRTPEWALTGATTPGTPCFPAGHNGFAAWGSTAALHDNTDFFLEILSLDGVSVLDGDTWKPCRVVEERIQVKDGPDIIERVLITPRGPIVNEAFNGIGHALSIKSIWLEPLPIRGFLDVQHAKSFEQFRRCFEQWPLMGQYLVYADISGSIGWQLVGQVPRRERGWGMLPQLGCHNPNPWPELVPFEEMPHGENPEQMFFATANNPPQTDRDGPYLGYDWVCGYRAAQICEALASRSDWTVDQCLNLQMQRVSRPWASVRHSVLCTAPRTPKAARALSLLRSWDGWLGPESPGASMYIYFFCELAAYTAKAKAPKGWEWALGKGFGGLMPFTLFADRRFEHVASLLQRRAEGWLHEPWDVAINTVLSNALDRLERESGRAAESARWGEIRPLTLKHLVFGNLGVLKHVFNRGPFPGGGDSNTIFQSTVNPLNPLEAATNVPNLRMVIDVGDWAESAYILCGGQSGNPLSPYYDDMIPLWLEGKAVRIPWREQDIEAATRERIELLPSGKALESGLPQEARERHNLNRGYVSGEESGHRPPPPRPSAPASQ